MIILLEPIQPAMQCENKVSQRAVNSVLFRPSAGQLITYISPPAHPSWIFYSRSLWLSKIIENNGFITEKKNQAHCYTAAIMSPVRVTPFVKTQTADWIGLVKTPERNYGPLTGLREFLEFRFCSLTLTGSLIPHIIQADSRGFLNIYCIMNWPHSEHDYYFCLGINLNFSIK